MVIDGTGSEYGDTGLYLVSMWQVESRPAKQHDVPESPSYTTDMAATSQECGSHQSFLGKECFGFLQALVTEKIGFKFHISPGDFTCSFDYNGADPPTQTRSSTVKVKRKSPSTRKKNAERRQLFLENKKRAGSTSGDLEQARSAAASFAKVKARESKPDKVLEVEEKEREEEAGNTLVLETVDIATENPDSPLDLNPRPIHFQQRNSGGSAESLDTSADPSQDKIVEVTEFMQLKRQGTPGWHKVREPTNRVHR